MFSCRVRQSDLVEKDSQKIKTKNSLILILILITLSFPYLGNVMNKFPIAIFGYENRYYYPIYLLKVKLRNYLDLLLVSDVYIKIYITIKQSKIKLYIVLRAVWNALTVNKC